MHILPPIFPFSTPIIAAILGIAFPLIIQTITTIDTKYGSNRLNEKFENEPLYRHLKISLVVAIVASVYNLLIVVPWKYDCCLVVNWIMSNSSNLILLLSTAYLVVVLFLVVNRLLVYLNYKKLFNYLHKLTGSKFKRTDNILDFVNLGGYFLLKDNNEKSREFYNFLSEYAQDKIKKTNSSVQRPFEYDDWFYNTILSVNNSLLRSNQRPISVNKSSDFVGLLLSQPADLEISLKTYNTLWRILQQQLEFNKTDLVYDYWAMAYQYAWLSLKPKNLYGLQEPTEKDMKDREKRDNQIRQFREFHFALCGYILYKEEYGLLKKIVDYSQADPPQYPLTPSSFQEIFDEFEVVAGIDPRLAWSFQEKYNFEDEKGINAGDIPIAWYKRYLTLLLFRLNNYKVKYLPRMGEPWDFPVYSSSPQTIKNKQYVADQMLYFTELWDKTENKVLFDVVGYEVREGEPIPQLKLKEFLNTLKDNFEQSQKSLEVSERKVGGLKRNTKQILENSAYVYNEILTQCKENIEESKLIKEIINVSRTRTERKDLFSEKGVINHLNFDEIDAQIAEMDFLSDYSLVFYKHAKRRYTINGDDILQALDQLLANNIEEYAVISFGDYFYSYKSKENSIIRIMEEDEVGGENRYRPYIYREKLRIYTLPSVDNGVMNSAVLIIKKSDLPCYENYKPNSEFLDERRYKPVDAVDNKLNIFVAVIFDNFPEEHKSLENTELCLVSLYYCVRLFWKKDADVTMLRLLSPYRDSGKGMNINDLPKLKG